ncbi:MAG: dUTP diphosphatase [Alphaproteobacteria bacterium]|nr:dUTP diphosphatase [Alphaproteobacteria bacterium]
MTTTTPTNTEAATEANPQSLAVAINLLPHAAAANLPSYGTIDSAGADLVAAIDAPITLAPGQRALIACGFSMALPQGFEGQVRPRSGLALKHGVTVLNTPGTIDADYRGEVKVILVNLGQEDFVVESGMRIAQLVIAPVSRVAWQQVQELPSSDRGAGGFGSTGTHVQAA